jgi:lysophospholipase
MGGTIAALYLAKYAGDFRAAVLSSPMLGIAEMLPLPFGQELPVNDTFSVAATLAASLFWSSPGELAIGQTRFEPVPPFEVNTVTNCRERYDMTIERTRTLYSRAESGGSANGWALAAIDATARISALAPASIQLPILMYQAGEDTMVRPAEQQAFCSRAASACRLEAFPASKHEIFSELDAVRTPALNGDLRYTGVLPFFAGH